MSNSFYKAFEDQFRGSRELIKERLRAYQPFLVNIKNIDANGKALDLGCGRGEWLEILAELKIEASGIDLDEGMLSDCRNLGLDVEQGNAIAKVSQQPDNSLVLISGFHIAEHLSNADLQTLIQESFRALKPGGLLILETPNTENISVATVNFYFDPSHLRPIPAKLLQFLTLHVGFTRSKIIGLQESTELRDGHRPPSLFQVLNDASPDYAVIAQKNASKEQLERFDTAFDKSYGLHLDQLAARYDADLHARIGRLESQLNQIRKLFWPVIWLKKKMLSLVGK
jgi:O-antigen chain-terminating methyltransferase